MRFIAQDTTPPAAAGSQQPFDATTIGTTIAPTAALSRFADMLAHSFGVAGLATSRPPDAIIPGLAPPLRPGEEPLIFNQTFSQIGFQMANSRGPLTPAARNLNFGGLLIGFAETMMTGVLDARVVHPAMQRITVLRQSAGALALAHGQTYKDRREARPHLQFPLLPLPAAGSARPPRPAAPDAAAVPSSVPSTVLPPARLPGMNLCPAHFWPHGAHIRLAGRLPVLSDSRKDLSRVLAQSDSGVSC